jgi:hypothetical protein
MPRIRDHQLLHADGGEAGADGALGLVLVGAGPAEVAEHAVAHQLGDLPLEAPTSPTTAFW